jgi:RNA polymerase sigma-70 factor, ECF subfamily
MSTWVTAVVINAVRMQIRRRPRGQMLSLDRSPKGDQSTPFSELLVDPRPTPEQTLEQQQLRQIVTSLSSRLPPSQRAALSLRQQDGLSIRETAEMLGVPVGTVEAQFARGRAKLIERFHKTTGRHRIEAWGSGSKTRRKAASCGRRGDGARGTACLPIPAVLSQQGGCEVWVSA